MRQPVRMGHEGAWRWLRSILLAFAARHTRRRDSVVQDQGKGKDGTDGTVATNCREMTIYDADERVWMLIRPKNRVFYDENSAFNTSPRKY
jgi:hypothetical protein